MFDIERIAEDLSKVVVGLDPACFDGRDAARLTEVAAKIERFGATAKALLARRAAETRAWVHASGAATPEQWLAQASGCSEGSAREVLATATRLGELPATAEKVRAGTLSLQQAAQVTAGAIADPSAEARLLRTAEHQGMRELRAEKERVVAAATDEPKARFDAARTAGERESQDAYRFDSLVTLAEHGTSPAPKPQPHAVRMRVDLPALLRGRTEPSETCEIPGVGPVSVAHAREVLSHGLLQLVITAGVDVQTVVSNTRHVPAELKIAIAERDRACKIRGCDCDRMLERHHTVDFVDSQRTTYRELGNLCPKHHDLVTHRSYTIQDRHDGTWSLHAPADEQANAPPHEAAA